ncbi:MAG TPA: response regulator, partial [Acidimicrobiales bacterium]|nr:response regulator [Acidimicrobiales bacterium]
MTRLLVVDDEAAFLRAMAISLRARGYEVEQARTGAAALELAARRRPDIVILDLGLPDLDGVEVLRGLRAWSSAPVVVLSARHAEEAKVEALDAGADDYVTKPFGMDELLARLRALQRRAEPGEERREVRTAHFLIDLAAKTATRDGAEVKLTPTEWRLVETLVASEGKLVPQRMLAQSLWGSAVGSEGDYLRVLMSR